MTDTEQLLRDALEAVCTSYECDKYRGWEMGAPNWHISMQKAKEALAATSQQAEGEPIVPAEFDIRRILLDVVPGIDGMGEEVYAKSVDDVIDRLGKLGRQVEDLQLAAPLPAQPQGLKPVDVLILYWKERAIAAEDKNEFYYQDYQVCKAAGYTSYKEFLTAYNSILKHLSEESPPAPVTKEEAFCDGNCTWRDHHPDCIRAAPQAAVPSDREECEHCQLWSKWADRIGKLIQEVGLPSTAPSSPVAVSDSEIFNVGTRMANVMFNFAQKGGHTLTTDDEVMFDTLRKEWDAARALSHTAPVVAEGFVIVPKVPTEEMELAGMEASVIRRPSIDDPAYVLSIYNAMLSTSPSAAQGEGT